MKVVVKIPKRTLDYIQMQKWFRYYSSLDEFVNDAIRKLIERQTFRRIH